MKCITLSSTCIHSTSFVTGIYTDLMTLFTLDFQMFVSVSDFDVQSANCADDNKQSVFSLVLI